MPMSEKEYPSKKKCQKCGYSLTYRVWESSCGGYEDYYYTCQNEECNHTFWIDGIDS